MKKILSYNVNGIRSAINKGLINFIEAGQFDVICFQEIKAMREQVDVTALEALGYTHHWFSAEKKGYSGVATFSKESPTFVSTGMDHAVYDSEGRIIRTDFGDWTLLNCYFPSGTSGDERQAVKFSFLKDFLEWVTIFKKTRPSLIIVGDYNIAHREIDIHSPKTNQNSSGFLPEERTWMTQWFEAGFTDAFRFANPTEQTYSWWSARFNSRAQNKGWRIDYQSVSNNLRDKIVSCKHLNEAVHSDHCPVLLEIDI